MVQPSTANCYCVNQIIYLKKYFFYSVQACIKAFSLITFLIRLRNIIRILQLKIDMNLYKMKNIYKLKDARVAGK